MAQRLAHLAYSGLISLVHVTFLSSNSCLAFPEQGGKKMPVFPNSLRRWQERALGGLISAGSLLVFAFLDLVDFVLCFFYRLVDGVLEENPIPCYCWNREKQRSPDRMGAEEEEEVSETFHGRRNLLRDMGLVSFGGRSNEREEKGGAPSRSVCRWSDCGCESCLAWQGEEEEKLYVMVREPCEGI